jgi:hypothetical protein
MWKNSCKVNGNVNDGEMASNSKEDSFHKQGRLQNFYIRQRKFLSVILFRAETGGGKQGLEPL